MVSMYHLCHFGETITFDIQSDSVVIEVACNSSLTTIMFALISLRNAKGSLYISAKFIGAYKEWRQRK